MEDPVALALRQRRSIRGNTYEALALEMGIAPNTVSSMAQGKLEVSLLMLKKVAEFFQWDLSEVGAAVMIVKEHRKRKKK